MKIIVIMKLNQCRNHNHWVLWTLFNVHENWSLTLREGHRLRVFENNLLRRIFPLRAVLPQL
jgi:hypothetical protein